MTARLEERLRSATAGGGKCLMPYLTAGFPDLDATVALIERCSAAGCPALEIGFPFSDSIADGPVIQESFYRALDAGFRVDALFEAIARVRARTSAALVAMVSMSLVMKRGPEKFVRAAAGAGFDGLIVPDVPIDEAAALSHVAESAGLCNVLMIAPTSATERQARIAAAARGFLYVIATRGITGERSQVEHDLADHVEALRKLTSVPLIAGFGVSTPAHVREICQHADGVIVGSAIIRRIAAAAGQGASTAQVVEAVGSYVDELRSGLSA